MHVRNILIHAALSLTALTAVGVLPGREAAASTAPQAPAVREIEVIVDGGYRPGRITVAEGERVHLKFVRREHSPCTREVVFPGLDIRRELPTDQPVVIELPALTPARMRDLKPNVAFKVPPEIQQFMDKLNLQGLLDGEAKKKAGIKFGMICGFSIPLITICAFIVLQIFLVLLHIVFFWLPFIRICIPFPVLTSESEEGS